MQAQFTAGGREAGGEYPRLRVPVGSVTVRLTNMLVLVIRYLSMAGVSRGMGDKGAAPPTKSGTRNLRNGLVIPIHPDAFHLPRLIVHSTRATVGTKVGTHVWTIHAGSMRMRQGSILFLITFTNVAISNCNRKARMEIIFTGKPP